MPTLGTERGLVQKGLGRSEDSRGSRQLSRYDPTGRDGGLEGAPGGLPSQRDEEMVPGEGDAPAHYHHFGIEHIEQVGNSGAEEAGRVGDDLERQLVAGVGRLVNRLRRDLSQVAADEGRKAALSPRLHRLD